MNSWVNLFRFPTEMRETTQPLIPGLQYKIDELLTFTVPRISDTNFLSVTISGVADGVGGWRNYGVDPSKFPQTLMTTCERMVSEGHFRPQCPASIISEGYYELLQQKTPLVGEYLQSVRSDHSDRNALKPSVLLQGD